MSVPLLHSKTCLLAVLYVPLVIMARRFLQMPLRPESHLYDMPTLRPLDSEPRLEVGWRSYLLRGTVT